MVFCLVEIQYNFWLNFRVGILIQLLGLMSVETKNKTKKKRQHTDDGLVF